MPVKRLSALLLVFVLLAPLAVLAEEISCVPGDTVDLVFALAANPNQAVAATMKLEYDHGAFELIPSSWVQNDAAFAVDMHGIPLGYEIPASFQVLPSAQGGEYTIELRVDQAGDIDENEVDGLVFSSFQVKVTGLRDELAAAQSQVAALTEELRQAQADLAAAKEELDQKTAEVESLRVELEMAAANTVSSPETDFEYTIVDGKTKITKYTGHDEKVMIPSTLGGAAVYRIGNNVFRGMDFITSAIVPEGVTEIGINAFSKCTNLQEITLPASLQSIDDTAFFYCPKLKRITIGKNVEFIGASAFNKCAQEFAVQIVNNAYAVEYCQNNHLNYQER